MHLQQCSKRQETRTRTKKIKKQITATTQFHFNRNNMNIWDNVSMDLILPIYCVHLCLEHKCNIIHREHITLSPVRLVNSLSLSLLLFNSVFFFVFRSEPPDPWDTIFIFLLKAIHLTWCLSLSANFSHEDTQRDECEENIGISIEKTKILCENGQRSWIDWRRCRPSQTCLQRLHSQQTNQQPANSNQQQNRQNSRKKNSCPLLRRMHKCSLCSSVQSIVF